MVSRNWHKMQLQTLTTPRLTLRPLRPSDSAAVFAYRSDPAVARFQMWEPSSEAEVRTFIEGLQDLELDTPDTWYQLAITLRDNGILIGDCGLHFPREEPHQVEVGITLAPAHQGQGYATEALEGMMEFLFVNLGKHRVVASVDPRNEPSTALLERVGMRKEGHLRESVWVKGEWADDAIYAILEREWRLRQLSSAPSRPANRESVNRASVPKSGGSARTKCRTI